MFPRFADFSRASRDRACSVDNAAHRKVSLEPGFTKNKRQERPPFESDPNTCTSARSMPGSEILSSTSMQKVIDVAWVAAMLAPVPLVPMFDPSATQHECHRPRIHPCAIDSVSDAHRRSEVRVSRIGEEWRATRAQTETENARRKRVPMCKFSKHRIAIISAVALLCCQAVAEATGSLSSEKPKCTEAAGPERLCVVGQIAN